MSITKEQALERAQRLCVKSEHCEYDIRLKLRQWQVEPDTFDSIISSLISDKFIDPVRYARSFTRDKSTNNKWGATKIRYALIAKGINADIIDNAIAENLNDDELLSTLVKLLKSKLRTIHDDDMRSRHAKLFRFAVSRGYTLEQTNEALGQIENI